MGYSYQYAFALGHAPELSKLEIEKVLRFRNVAFKELFYHPEVLALELNKKIPIPELQKQLGGTVKIAEITGAAGALDLPEKLSKLVVSEKENQNKRGIEGKWQFGFSVYGCSRVKEFSTIGLAIKKKLKQDSNSIRFIESSEKALSSVIVVKENLLTKGLDVIIIKTPEKYLLCKTLSAQDFAGYARRDYGRPSADAASGLLPPKLAQMMINISQLKSNEVLLDPFCGSGTVLQEALFLGFNNLMGSDISAKAIADAKNNLAWLKTKYALPSDKCQVFKADARRLSSKIPAISVDGIVSEPYLGEQKKSKINRQDLVNLEKLYCESFAEFKKILKPKGAIVFVLPVINGQTMEILGKIREMGFIQEKISQNPRGSLIYRRPSQKVFREIFIFRCR